MKNKIFLIIMCVFLMLNSVMAMASFNVESENASYVLGSLGIMNGDEDGQLRLNDNVTRAEFIKMAVMSSEHKNKVSIGIRVSVFPDCTANHWASPYVSVAVHNGITLGHSDGTFGPDDNITYAQAITVMLRLLGYSDEEFANTWPDGQLAMAESLKINDSIDKTGDEYMTRQDIAVLIINTLGTQKKSSSSEYISSLGYSIINDCLIVATSKESSFVNKGKILTSSGEYNVDEAIDSMCGVGSIGDAVISEDSEIICFVPYGRKVENGCVYSSGDSTVVLCIEGSFKLLECDDLTPCYHNGKKTTFSSARSGLGAGDKIYVTYTTDNTVESVIIGESDFEGPVTIWKDTPWKEILGADSQTHIVRNSKKISENELKDYDIVYYSKVLNTAFAYSKKVNGVYTSAYPDSDTPEKVTVSGTEYQVETANAYFKLRPDFGISFGDNIVLLLGRNGEVADVIGESGYVENDYSTGYHNVISPDAQSREVALLETLGSIEAQNGALQDLSEYISRGEFAKMAIMASPFSSKVATGLKISVFSDCTYNHPMAPYVKVAAENSVMSAYSDFTFRPDELIKNIDALEALLSILGYSNIDFGYSRPQGQMSFAKNLGITDSVNADADEFLTRNQAISMIYNMLGTKMKASQLTCLESMGYNYYEDAVIIATPKESTSVGSGKILTSEGVFNADVQISDSVFAGEKGDLLIKSGKLIMLNPADSSYGYYTVQSVISGGAAVVDNGETIRLSLSDSTTVYYVDSVSAFSDVKNKLFAGDMLTVCYDSLMRPEYVHIQTSLLKGPYVSGGASNLFAQIPDADVNSLVVRNGKKDSYDSIRMNDILYYSQSLDTVYAYSKRITGIFEGAYPSQDSPDSIVLSGVTYKLEGTEAVTAFSSGNIEFGDTVSVCMGRGEKVAFAYSLDGESFVGYLISSGIKTFTNSNSETYTSVSAGILMPDGNVIYVHTTGDYSSWINNPVQVEVIDGVAKLVVLSSNHITLGTVDYDNLKVGSYNLAEDAEIIDVGYNSATYPTVYTDVFLQRLDGITLNSSNVLYYKADNNVITEMILLDATGDAFSYGVITSAQTKVSDRSATGSYTCYINGESLSYSGGAYTNIHVGSVVKTAIESGRDTLFNTLSSKRASIKDISYTKLTLSDGSEMKLSDSIGVYKLSGTSTYTLLPFSQLIENTQNYYDFVIYTDKPEKNGGRVRVIVVREKK